VGARALKLAAAAAILMVAITCTSACSWSRPKTTTSAPPTPASSLTPSNAEIAAAIKRLAPSAGFHYTIAMAPKPGGDAAFATIGKVELDANGRWLAHVHLQPPMSASCWPAIMVLAKDPSGWRIVSVKADTHAYDRSTPTPALPAQ